MNQSASKKLEFSHCNAHIQKKKEMKRNNSFQEEKEEFNPN